MKFVIGTLLALMAVSAQAEIYKCRLADGRIEISSSPCSGGSKTLSARPAETVPDTSREEAERDVARMRSFVEQREAEQRRDEAAYSRQLEAEQQASAARSVYETHDMDACLRELGRQNVDAGRRAELEAICRAKGKPAPTVIAVPVPAYPAHGIDACIQNVLRLRLALTEQERRIAQCRVIGMPPITTQPRPRPRPRQAQPEPPPPTRQVAPCPNSNRPCLR
jgi:hypothetical protein